MRWTTLLLFALGCGSSPPPAAPTRAAAPRAPETRAPETRAAETHAPEPLLAAGGVSACARLGDELACWGSWADAVPAEADFDPAAPRPLGADVEEVALGWTHGCTRHADGAVRCFGRLDLAPAPPEVPELHGAHALTSGRDFTCALDADGRIECFAHRPHLGLRGYGEPSALSPVVVPVGAGWTRLAATSSGWQLCAAGPTGVICWANLDAPPVTVAVPPGVADLALAPDHGCARGTDGSVRCWRRVGRGWSDATVVDGLRADTLVGLHDRVCARRGRSWSCIQPGAEASPWTTMEGASAVAGGMGFVCGLFDDGVIRCAGQDAYGQLGTYGAARPSTGPPRRTLVSPASTPPVTQLAMAGAQVCVARADGTVACVGQDGALAPVRGVRRVTRISVGGMHVCARTEAGDVLCWGAMTLDHGEDVDAPYLEMGRPRRFARRATDLVSGQDHACARTGPAELRCWGSRWAIGADTSRPFARFTLPPDTQGLVAAGDQTCSIDGGGTVRCFGRGVGGGAPGGPFVEVPAWAGAVELVPEAEGCALLGGVARCWGRNVFGEVGDGTRTPRAQPTAVHGLADVRGIAVGDRHRCALLGDGTVRCWGSNAAGQLGDGTRDDRWRPIEVPGLGDVVALGAGLDETCAVRRDGAVECWGEAVDPEAAAPAFDVEALFR